MTKIKLMTGKEFAERIDFVLSKRKQSRKAITTDLNISSSTISSWAAGRGSIPNANIVAQIAEYLNVTTDWLITGKEPKHFECSESEQKHLLSFRLLDERDKLEIEDLIEIKLNRTMSRQNGETSAVPSA